MSEAPPTVRRLPNGLRVVVQTRDVPLASIVWWTNTGSTADPTTKSGSAHFLEHMLFKGTQTYGVGEAPKAIESLGGDLNAYTSLEQTVLHATVLSDGWQQAVSIIADMALHSLIDPEETDRERQVVLEEIRGAVSDPDELLYRKLQSASFPEHAYARPILGSAEHVSAIASGDLIAFWKQHWTAHNTVVSICGDVDPEAVVRHLTAVTSGWESDRAPVSVSNPVAPSDAATIHVKDETRQSRIAEFLWQIPGELTEDFLALEALALALMDGPGAAVTERLSDDGVVIAEPRAGAVGYRDGGTLSLAFVPDKGSAQEQCHQVLTTVNEVIREGLDPELVERVVAGMAADLAFELETVDGMAWRIAHGLVEYDDAGHVWRRIAQIRALTAERLNDVARRYIADVAPIVGLMSPELPQFSITAPAAPIPDEAQRHAWTLDNGVKVHVTPSNSPSVGLSIRALGGRAEEHKFTPGIAVAWGEMVTAGADELSAGRFSAALDRTGGRVWGSATRTTLGVHGKFPAERARTGIQLALATISDPEFDPQAWERVREELIHEAESAGDFASWVASRAIWNRIWSGHPWSKPAIASPYHLRRITLDEIRRFHDHQFRGRNIVVSIDGPIAPAVVERLLHETIATLPAGRPPRSLRAARADHPATSTTLRRTAPGEQAHVELGILGLPSLHPDYPKLLVLCTILGSQGGRLFLELRERNSLAYSVWAEARSALLGGCVHIGLACSPDRVAEARAALEAQLHALASHPPTDEEVLRAQRILQGYRVTDMQRSSWRARFASQSLISGQSVDPLQDIDVWNAVSTKELRAFTAALLERPRTWVVVLPEESST